ncbi:glycosyltransferase family 4 protein [Vibrio variabilis]|uniref:glycosyltransferase family 4 protein n=1 Tax=Vibrio variabilis TaxID=990271 RepID=UPI000DD6F819|nr:glycosyltransferase family 4 protein [Vibrio variabilis]
MEKIKGVHTLISAMTRHPDKKLLIVGQGPYEEELRGIVKEHGLTNVDFLGFKQGEELWELVRKSKAIMVPSEWYENCSMTVLEGKAYSKPIVASSIGGITEQVKDGENGFLHEPGDVESISNAIERLYSSSYNDVAKNSRLDLDERYSKEVYYNQLSSLYQEVINARSTR